MAETDNAQNSLGDEQPHDFAGGEVEVVELAQGLGLAEALAIGVGTMVCAGIFVLPGIIIARTGPAAVISFFLGGLVALLAAMSTAEVATGMPKSGGGYYFISRALGPLWGAIIGWGSWFGLIFASAFYMVGFGEYIALVLDVPVTAAALVMTVLLVGLNLIGSEAAGKTQNFTVAILLAVLLLFTGRGAFSADLGMLFSQKLAPFGFGAIAASTALLFVSYCGFAEIASMAEEIRDPGRNLPRALVGSVVIVTVLYCVILFVCISLRPSSELSGSTLLADLADDMMGPWGRGAILIGAVMAMLSSANASIMSAARIIFAMGRDRLVWDWLNAVHPRFRVPYIAILVTGALIMGCILIGNLELLAEAAGLLHLLLYGLMGIACIIMRGARPEAYHPVYRVPAYPAVPLLAAAGCFAVALFVEPFVALAGMGLIAFAIGHYYLVGRRECTLSGAWPYFLRRGILEPALAQTECWGAMPEQIPTAMVALANPQLESARLQIAAGMMGPVQGEVLVANIFLADFREGSDEEIISKYYQTIAQRNRVLQEAAAPIIQAGARAISHVPLTGSVFAGLLSAAEASGASLIFLGWPDRDNLWLLGGLDLHLRANVLVLREAGPVPAGNILVLIDESIHGELALLCAARLANTWNAALSVASLVEEEASHESQLEVEAALEARVGDRVRATLRAIPAPSLAAIISSEAPFADMIILGVPNGPGGRLVETIESLGDVEGCSGCSLVLVRGYET